jgi:hypothetical protein
MLARRSSMMTGIGFGLARLGSVFSSRPAIIRILQPILDLFGAIRATEAATFDLLAGLSDALRGTKRVIPLVPAEGGTMSHEAGRVSYTANRLFIGREDLRFEILDLPTGTKRQANIIVEVAPHPEVGVPFGDGTFFSDETGFAF